MRVTILDYGAGNLHSLSRALEAAGARVSVEARTERALAGDVLVLPGVGAFGAASEALLPARALIAERVRAGHPVIGICLGMQLLFETSEEGGGVGLGVLPGTVRKLAAVRVPHIGWAALEPAEGLSARAGLAAAYFAHGYICEPRDSALVTAWARQDGLAFPAAVRSGSIAGTQFHPEKSSRRGVEYLRLLLREVAA
jgi:imidazole glycerol-phosphate synthase subunit HisH